MAVRSVFVCCCFILYFCSRSIADTKSTGYISLGCWSIDGDLIPSVEDTDDELDGSYWDRVQPVLKCAWAAKDLGYTMFAVRNGGECLTSTSVSKVYKQHGQSDECDGGKGGHEAMNVYELKGKLSDVVDFEGDVILSKVQQAMTMPTHYDNDVASKGVWTKADFKWPDGVVPYFIPPKLKNHQLVQKMLSGFRHWEEQTCVKFVPKKHHRDWVELVREKNPMSIRCASAIGRNGRKQQMRLGDLCPAGSVIHEWGHVLGLWHTQSRPDREDYVKILWKNIIPGASPQFKKYSHGVSDTLGVKYDYSSIMHYGKDFFGKLSKDKSRILTTIKTKDPKYQDVIGQRKYLSNGDLLLVNRMYGCPDFPYMWRTKEWGACSTPCGTGTQKRDIYCAQKDGKKVSDKKCKHTRLPKKRQKCYGRKCRTCPRGWHRFKEACYYLQLTHSDWSKAQRSCLQKGSSLAAIRDNEEEKEIRKYIKSKNLQTLYFWIGAKYNFPNGDFMWTDKTSIDFHAWKKGEPRWGMDCVILMNHKNWGTDNCAGRRCSICKKELHDYKLPKVNGTKQSEYKWYSKEWSKCSVTCGGGQKHRETFCARKNGTERAHYYNCTETPPDAWKNCNSQPCPSPYRWYSKKWQKCSVTCGGGYQRREIICATKAKLPTAWEMCNHTKTPVFQRRCNTQPCPTTATWNVPEWKTSEWTHCSVTCGTGRQIRHVVCRASKSGKRLHHLHCHAHRKPASVRLCSNAGKCRKRKKQVLCSDKNVMCHFWRRQNLCHRSGHVKKSCRKSCGLCKM